MEIELRFGGKHEVVDRKSGAPTEVRVFGSVVVDGVADAAVEAVKLACVRAAAESLAEVADDLHSLGEIDAAWSAALLARLNGALAARGARAVRVVDVSANVSG